MRRQLNSLPRGPHGLPHPELCVRARGRLMLETARQTCWYLGWRAQEGFSDCPRPRSSYRVAALGRASASPLPEPCSESPLLRHRVRTIPRSPGAAFIT